MIRNHAGNKRISLTCCTSNQVDYVSKSSHTHSISSPVLELQPQFSCHRVIVAGIIASQTEKLGIHVSKETQEENVRIEHTFFSIPNS
jgi:hypothetical protein